MVQVTLSAKMYEVLLDVLQDAMCQTIQTFKEAPLNSSEEYSSGIHMSILFDIQAALVTTAQTVG